MGKDRMADKLLGGAVVAVSCNGSYQFSKPVRESIHLIAGLGVEGDAHLGVTVRHRSRVAKDPTRPNLRQVHLMHEELHDELRAGGFHVAPGALGENITTRGVELLALPRGALLHIGDTAVVTVTGLRDPCKQLNNYQPGLMAAVLGRDERGNLIRKAGIMGTVLTAGKIRAGDQIRVEIMPGQTDPLEPV
jgi:hypothetical protein